MKCPSWIPSQVFNEQVAAGEVDVERLIGATQVLVKNAFERQQQQMGKQWPGTLEQWQTEALQALRERLKVYAGATNNGELLRRLERWSA